MEYEEIVTEYLSGSIDISNLKKKLEIVRPLNARPEGLKINTVMNSMHIIRECVNVQLIANKPEKVEQYKSEVDALLVEYFSSMVERINYDRAWGIMKVVPTKITKADYIEFSTKEKLTLVKTLNRKFTEYLQVQKYADLREYLINNEDTNDYNIKRMQFIIKMFYNLKSKEVQRDFCYIPKYLLTSLMGFKKSHYVRLEDYFSKKIKHIRIEYEKYAQFFSSEDFRDIIDNLQITSKTLKVSVSKVIDYYSEISGLDYEISNLDDEYKVFEQLEEKNKEMFSLDGNEEMSTLKEENLKEKDIEQEEKEKSKAESLTFEEKIEKIQNNSLNITSKEQITPIILAWFGRENVLTSDVVDAKMLSSFFDKIKQIEKDSGIRVGLYIITNANKEVTLNRMQELKHKARAKGMPKLVEGALGNYGSFRIDKDENIIELKSMSKDTRKTIIEMLDKGLHMGLFKKDVVDPREEDYIRYIFSIKKNPGISFKYLKWTITQLLRDEKIKKQPLSFVPFIEGDVSGVDVLLQSQLEELDKLSDHLKSEYYIEPGKTMKASINAIDKFIEST
jgi:hypothetical protein